jgi:diguanylate cyclase
VTLRDLVASEIGPFDGRVKVIGRTSVILDVQMAQNLALILHELVANALKYGALSVPHGYVEMRLHWRRPELILQWKESGGPRPQPSINGGFGSRLLYSFAKRIGHDIEVRYEPTGLRYSMKANLNHDRSETPVPGEQEATAEAIEGLA